MYLSPVQPLLELQGLRKYLARVYSTLSLLCLLMNNQLTAWVTVILRCVLLVLKFTTAEMYKQGGANKSQLTHQCLHNMN